MLTKKDVQDWISENGFIQDIGQIDAETKKALNKAVSKGILTKSRIPWCGMVKKTTYTLK